jgi:Tol biopolymer transport system component
MFCQKIKIKKPAYFNIVLFLSVVSVSAQINDFPELTGPYLGQNFPGNIPELFAPGIICTEESEGSSGFALNGRVFIFQRFIDRDCHTYIMTSTEELRWSSPRLIPFWEQLIHNGDFVISADDKTMFYQVKRLISDRLDSDIWQVNIGMDSLEQRHPLAAPVNTPYNESFASQTITGDLYFFSQRPGGMGQFDLYKSDFENGVYNNPVNLNILNTPYHEWDPYISPRESYIIFCSTKPGGMGMDDLYISFKNDTNQWCDPIPMGDLINSTGSENRPYVTNDGRFLFYTSTVGGNRDIYWVDANVIEDLKPKEFK